MSSAENLVLINWKKERQAFEAWASHPYHALPIDNFRGAYNTDETAWAWLAWKDRAAVIAELLDIAKTIEIDPTSPSQWLYELRECLDRFTVPRHPFSGEWKEYAPPP